VQYNAEHSITPRGIHKAVADIMEGARGGAPQPSQLTRGRRRDGKRGEAAVDLKPEALAKQMKRLEAEMHKRARNLEFEEAARLRDEIERLKQLELGIA